MESKVRYFLSCYMLLALKHILIIFIIFSHECHANIPRFLSCLWTKEVVVNVYDYFKELGMRKQTEGSLKRTSDWCHKTFTYQHQEVTEGETWHRRRCLFNFNKEIQSLLTPVSWWFWSWSHQMKNIPLLSDQRVRDTVQVACCLQRG